MLDIIDRGREHALFGVNHALFDVLGAQAGEVPDDADHWNINLRQDVGRCPNQDKRRD